MKISTAIKQAQGLSRMSYRGERQWMVDTWDSVRGAWVEGNPTDYHKARFNRAKIIETDAGILLGLHCDEASRLAQNARNRDEWMELIEAALEAREALRQDTVCRGPYARYDIGGES